MSRRAQEPRSALEHCYITAASLQAALEVCTYPHHKTRQEEAAGPAPSCTAQREVRAAQSRLGSI